MPKLSLFIVSLTVIILTALSTLIFFSNNQNQAPKSEINTAINQAMLVYNQKKLLDEDFSSGPCLSNALMPGWVLDIAHSPRLALDDLVENQCPAYLEGRAKHFVELDPEGNLIKVK